MTTNTTVMEGLQNVLLGYGVIAHPHTTLVSDYSID